MSSAATKRLLRPFIEVAPAPMFLSGFFQSPQENFHTSESVEIDIMRDGEEVAVPIQDISQGNRNNENSVFSNKEFKPPIYKEEISLNAFQLLSRDPGENPFGNPVYQAKAINRISRGTVKVQNKIRRAVELMASQALQSGSLTLVNQAGSTVYSISFLPKATHFVTVGTDWGADGSGNPLGDLESLANVIRADGRRNPDVLVFGSVAYQRLLANEAVQKRISRDGIGLGQLAPQRRGGDGATFQGFIWVGNYRFEMWTYDGHYVHPNTGTVTPYVTSDHVIMLSSQARLDLTFGAIPMIAQPDSRVLQYLPPRVRNVEGGMDMTMNAWLQPDGQTISVSAGTRPLTIPTEIDSFGRLNVIA